MRGLKTLLGTSALLAGLALAPAAQAQIVVNFGVQPACSYGYYDYEPYACAPMGFYGPGYFHNGIFLGMGPWADWGYGHGWGSHRFREGGGGRYRGGGGAMANRSHYAGGRSGGGGQNRAYRAAPRGGGSHQNSARPSPSHNRGGGGGGRPNSGGHPGGGGGHN